VRITVAEFTVRATAEQSVRWKRAAEAEGHRSAGTWLASAADAYLKVRARAGAPLPLAWRRFGLFPVDLDGGRVTMPGRISPPFGVFRGDGRGKRRSGLLFALVYIPEARIIATLRTFQQAKALASEIAPSLLHGKLPDAAPIVERHVREAL
jgi:hypothetical protein